MKRAVVFIRFLRFLPLLFPLAGCSKTPPDDTKTIPALISHQNLGLAYLEENQINQAKAEYNEIIKLAPDESLGYANLGLALLRSGQFSDAEKSIKEALQKSDDPDIHLILVEVYDADGKESDAIREAEDTLRKHPDHFRLHHKAASLYSRSEKWRDVEKHLNAVVEAAPGNIAARLEYVQALIRDNRPQQAVEQLEEIRRQIFELPEGAAAYLESALSALRLLKTQDALTPAIAFQNLLKPTPLYQSSIVDLSGPGGAMIGLPIQHFSPQVLQKLKVEAVKQAALRFVDSTAGSGLDGISEASGFAAGDFDGDGSFDLWISGSGRLMKNSKGRFVDATSTSGIDGKGSVYGIFGDYDNDSKPDLFLLFDHGCKLFHNSGGGKFQDVTKASGISAPEGGAGALFFDFDNEGDLDILIFNNKRSLVYRNNGDGSFTEAGTQADLAAGGTMAAFGDFDEDGDSDLFVAGRGLMINRRQGRFQFSPGSGIASPGENTLVSAGDFNNDGFLDLLLISRQGRPILYRSKGDGSFAQEPAAPGASGFIDAHPCDFDNDGLRDLAFLNAGGLSLLRNHGSVTFEDFSKVALQGRSFGVLDPDDDGDLDLLVSTTDGKLKLLKNDGGNANHWINVRPVGLGPESGKNNRNSIGAKVEIKAGTGYQMAVVTEPVVHFGLGDQAGADVLRVTWTNGVAQNHIRPGSNQTFVEKQVLKGSCAFLYAWNGARFEFVTDVLWKSALGMPLGIMGGEVKYGFPDSVQEYLRIPGEQLKPRDGNYLLQITEELWETAYLDKSRLVLLDHPESTELYIDERFVIPPYPPLRIFPVTKKLVPEKAVDENGTDLLPFLREKDDRYAADFSPTRYQGIMETHDVILDLGKLAAGSEIVLFLDGWLFPTDASINVAVSQSDATRVVRPSLEVPDRHGNWKTVIPDLGFPQGKNKMMIFDLRGTFAGDYRIRIRTNMQIYWDQIFYTRNEPEARVRSTTLAPASAEIHYRGFSQMYRKGIDGPFWFDYSKVSTEQKWRDLTGYYTRYGDVTPLLSESDDRYVTINSGDEISVRYDASGAPALPSGWKRDYLLYSDGWMKDGDLSTVEGRTVDPYPFHGMKSYPYGPGESFPRDPAHQAFLREYLTRKVTAEKFRKLER